MIKKDHRDLRSGAAPTTTRPGYIGTTIAAGILELDSNRSLPMAAEGARARHSWAGMCAKRISYEVAGVEPSEPVGENVSAQWSFALGHLAHDLVQQAITRTWAATNARVTHEVPLDCGTRAGTADTVIEWDEPVPFPIDGTVHKVRRLVGEWKSMGGFKFRKQVTEEGPSKSAYLQAALNGVAAEADMIVLGSMALDQMSPNVAKSVYGPDFDQSDRFWAEWWYPRSVFEVDGIAEGLRLERIVKMVDEGKLVPRHVPGEMPDNARIVDPSCGMWEVRIVSADRSVPSQVTQAGLFWGCAYCPFQSHCVSEKAAGR